MKHLSAWIETGPLAQAYHRSGVRLWALAAKIAPYGIILLAIYFAVWFLILALPFIVVLLLASWFLTDTSATILVVVLVPLLFVIRPFLVILISDVFNSLVAFGNATSATQMGQHHKTKLAEITS